MDVIARLVEAGACVRSIALGYDVSKIFVFFNHQHANWVGVIWSVAIACIIVDSYVGKGCHPKHTLNVDVPFIALRVSVAILAIDGNCNHV